MRLAAIVLSCVFSAATTEAHAVLGEDLASVHADAARLQAQHRTVLAAARTQVQEIVLSDGSSIRQYIAPGGRVYAVSWSTHFKPRLEQLLGQHHAAYMAHARLRARMPGIKRQIEVSEGDLVVQSVEHLQQFTGRAWLRSLVPQGMSVDALR